eukprot:GHVU01026921.1.p2 GENE.GHVU01026921.1~~GHVU01026921.1.p2  ORF type:complete len:107 (-),score=9.49 GHVU01026921.1:441-761(-)
MECECGKDISKMNDYTIGLHKISKEHNRNLEKKLQASERVEKERVEKVGPLDYWVKRRCGDAEEAHDVEVVGVIPSSSHGRDAGEEAFHSIFKFCDGSDACPSCHL